MKKEDEASTIISIRAHPKASSEKIQIGVDGKINIYVTSPPEKNEANLSIIFILSKVLKIPKRNIEICGGQHSKDKTVKIKGISLSELLQLFDLNVGNNR